MPFKYYHGRTGVIFNVNKRAVGIIVNKQVNGRVIPKRIHVSTPHVRPSKCADEIIRRVKENEAKKKEVRSGSGEKANLKRQHTGPKAGYFYTLDDKQTTIQPQPYIDLL